MKYLFLAFCALLLAGCVSESVQAKQRAGLTMLQKAAKIERHDLKLSLVGKREKLCGKEEKLTLKLQNNGADSITLIDWRLDAASNLRVECQVWFPGTDQPDENAWLTINEPPEGSARRYPLTLDPQNLITIDVPLEFVQRLRISQGAERRYFVRATVELDSVSVRSDVAAFTVHNP